MKSKVVAQLMADLGITKTHSRPYVSNDNPYSEAQFKTLKYAPGISSTIWVDPGCQGILPGFFPLVQQRTSSFRHRLDDTRAGPLWAVPAVLEHRSNVLQAAFKNNPNRFKNKIPKPPSLPEAAWINRPSSDDVRV